MGKRPYEFYPTPETITAAFLDRIGVQDMNVFEPCVGQGHMSNVLKKFAKGMHTNDLNPDVFADYHLDATKEESWKIFTDKQDIDFVVTNPPDSKAYEILKNALAYSEVGVAMYLRLSFLEPCRDRAGFLSSNPPKGLLVMPRVSFTGDGKTDSMTRAWMIWTHERYIGKPVEIVTRTELLALAQHFEKQAPGIMGVNRGMRDGTVHKARDRVLREDPGTDALDHETGRNGRSTEATPGQCDAVANGSILP